MTEFSFLGELSLYRKTEVKLLAGLNVFSNFHSPIL